MKKITLLILVASILGCTSYPKEPVYLVAKDHFTVKNAKKSAPYLHSNDVPRENGYAIYNLPYEIGAHRSSKNWGIITEKYKADLFYFINKKGRDLYIYRRIKKWHGNKEKKTLELDYLFDLLKAEGILKEQCTILHQNVWEKYHTRYVLLLYKGVKHNITLSKTQVWIKSYPESQQAYWESQGVFMLDTPSVIRDKWIEENK